MSQQEVAQIVEAVVKRMNNGPATGPTGRSIHPAGIYETMEEAVTAATAAQKKITNLEFRQKVINAMREAGVKFARELAEMAIAETGMGRVEDKVAKNTSQALKTPGPEVIHAEALSGDHGLTLIENAPWGVIASVTPSTNPAATIINNAISMISAGNSVVFAPHPAAKMVSQRSITVLNEAIIAVGGPRDLLTTVVQPSIETAQQLFKYPGVGLLVVTGGEAVVHEARRQTDKRLIAAGAGNPPVVVDETADIPRAAACIVAGASFDNNIICVDEKEIIVVDCVADQLKKEMTKNHAVELDDRQAEAVARVILKDYPGPNPVINRKMVGRDATKIALEAGIQVPPDTRLLFAETDKSHPFAQIELMMPVISVIRANNADAAIDIAIELEHDLHHTAAMHSKNIDTLHRMSREINTSIFVKNGSCIAGLGFGGEGWTSMTISTPTGEGVTCSRTFIRLRRCVVVDHFRIV
ncbi:MAG TPA: aldehyde dehydrogenase EutE [bacterium]|nr:aldehyde dehydrogenase EutE [bacterium]HNT65264.1 aldehyde dehydrogenase EutE [bacterium]HOX86933.1 aldehyde dehydrogenase EutE [bacterium]HPG46264.1 aldehyde dehydrogenase EutE [bacterium]HPM98542.1 aldehyde dehydrogenase EutE [bacterium]